MLRAKVGRGVNPHQATSDLDFVDVCAASSSIAATVGLPGQGNYRRQTRFWTGLPLTGRAVQGWPISLAWGLWEHLAA